MLDLIILDVNPKLWRAISSSSELRFGWNLLGWVPNKVYFLVVKALSQFKMLKIYGMNSCVGFIDFNCLIHEACFTIPIPYFESRNSFSWSFLHKCDFRIVSNNFLVGSFLIQIFLVLDLQWCFYNEKSEKMDDFWGAISPSSTVGFQLYFLRWISNRV